MSQTDPRKQTQTGSGVTIPGAVIRMQQPNPSNLPQQKPIDDDDTPQLLPTPWWKKALKRVLMVVLVVLALVFGYLFLLMGEPEEELEP